MLLIVGLLEGMLLIVGLLEGGAVFRVSAKIPDSSMAKTIILFIFDFCVLVCLSAFC